MFFFIHLNIYGQSDTVENCKLILDFPIIDFTFHSASAKTYANHRNNIPASISSQRSLVDYFSAYGSLSMKQIISMSQNLHGTGYYVANRISYKIINQGSSTKRKLLNRLIANVIAIPIDYGLAHLPFGVAFVHEEFHRNIMTLHGVYSYDMIWDFTGDIGGYVYKVKDTDLSYLKSKSPSDFIRLASAGIEGNHLFVRNMEKLTFFEEANYPNVGLLFMTTNDAVSYVNTVKPKYDPYIDELLKTDTTEYLKDFTGFDIHAWVYDLFRPEENYDQRGEAPFGNNAGIRRYIKSTDLTLQELEYAKKMGNRAYINYLSPNLLGIQSIKFNNHLKFNFAFRHILNSFGDDRSVDIFVIWKNKNILFTPHLYSNYHRNFPGVELGLFNEPLTVKNKQFFYDIHLMLWMQPDNQSFYSKKASPGGLFEGKIYNQITNNLRYYVAIEMKTSGWVAGNPYLNGNFSSRLGLSFGL